ncbi:aminodeoxychorismate lyase [Pseudaeromonas sp. ZJS20]|uniref:aminodeoxychorismate lyase n=1 Tax=Pseudaeromonas aegiceratis TaxID=3153928 RepID=UPI00390CBCD1
MQLLDGNQATGLSPADRGLTLGDGFFSTLHVLQGQICLLPYHLARIQTSLTRLAFPPLDLCALSAALQARALGLEEGVMKIIVTRGQGGRGYSPVGCLSPTVILSLHPYPEHYRQWQRQGIALGELGLRLGLSPLLAGLKTLGRLEQVLFKAELESQGQDEALVCDVAGQMVEAVTANLFWRQGEQVFTPDLAQAGVAGVMRAWCLKQLAQWHCPVHEVRERPDALAQADEIWLTNALMGLVPVRHWRGKDYPAPGILCRQLQMSYHDDIKTKN